MGLSAASANAPLRILRGCFDLRPPNAYSYKCGRGNPHPSVFRFPPPRFTLTDQDVQDDLCLL